MNTFQYISTNHLKMVGVVFFFVFWLIEYICTRAHTRARAYTDTDTHTHFLCCLCVWILFEVKIAFWFFPGVQQFWQSCRLTDRGSVHTGSVNHDHWRLLMWSLPNGAVKQAAARNNEGPHWLPGSPLKSMKTGKRRKENKLDLKIRFPNN